MTRQLWLLTAVVVGLLTGSGCVSCGSKGYGLARDAGPECDIPECQRNQVYVFAVGGLNPAGAIALDSLRLKLNELGFAKVASGQIVHTPWMASEMRRIHAEIPDAVFVIVGTESGGPSAVKLAEKAAAEGLPLVAMVFLDADGKTPAPQLGVRTLTVGSGYGVANSTAVESMSVPNVGRYGLLTDPRTVEAVGQVLKEAALAIPYTGPSELTEWSYPHAPEMRPSVEIGKNIEWAYLFDYHGGNSRAITESVPVLAAKPSQTITTSARGQ